MAQTPRISRLKSKLSFKSGFALPTILIASIVMLTVLLVGVTSTSTTRVALQSQYYEQLAHAAGDAGIAYAEACLDKNGGAPLWSDANPLKPSTDCSGVALAGVVCPDGVSTFYTVSTPAICSVTMNNNVRSSFSIKRPVLDGSGNATTIPNSGFVELIRDSTGAVWRSYTQAAAQPSAVPALCSGATTQALGWSVAGIGSGAAFPDAAAEPISLGAGWLNPGEINYRKDFNVVKDGTYTINSLADDMSQVYIDGKFVLSSSGFSSVGTTTIPLTVGCHTVQVIVTNSSVIANNSSLKFSLKLAGTSIPLIVSDNSWRVTAGNSAHYSSPNYYQSSGWTAVRQIQAWNVATVWGTTTPAWDVTTGDPTAQWVSTTHSYTSTATYPASSTVNFRMAHDVYFNSPLSVKLAYACDDACTIYLDGNQIVTTNAGWSVLATTTITIPEGNHRFGISLSNGGAGASGFIFTVQDASGYVITNSNSATWVAADTWYATDQNPFSYDTSFVANPTLPSTTAGVLVVAGGGAGGGSAGTSIAAGGGGGGGVIYNGAYRLYPGQYSVTVGAGGTGTAGFVVGNKGANSSFDTLIAIGGGGGGTWSATPTIGGSGGGSSENSQGYIGVSGILNQGLRGGNGYAGYDGGATSAGGGGGGFGAVGGNAGANTAGGAGGAGVSNSISGTARFYGAGGGGAGSTTGGAGGSGIGGTGRAVTTGVGTNATANRGGGGGGALTNANEASQAGGNGGSGVVIISYPTGSITASGGTITTSGGNTIHTFTSSGTFTVTSIP